MIFWRRAKNGFVVEHIVLISCGGSALIKRALRPHLNNRELWREKQDLPLFNYKQKNMESLWYSELIGTKDHFQRVSLGAIYEYIICRTFRRIDHIKRNTMRQIKISEKAFEEK